MLRNRASRPGLVALLLALAGGAQADGIAITGEVSMGLIGGSGQPHSAAVRFVTDLDLQMRFSHTTDGGLTFALELDLDDLEAGPSTPSPDIPRRR
jgi:hypothetical protein